MRKMISLIVLVLLLTGYQTVQNISEPVNENVRFAGLKGKVVIATDNETGCKYLREEYGEGNYKSLTSKARLNYLRFFIV